MSGAVLFDSRTALANLIKELQEPEHVLQYD
jgi:hypothetical protein